MRESSYSAQFTQQTLSLLKQEVIKHRLPDTFLETVSEFYLPLATQLNYRSQRANKSPYLVGLQGSQGSGKSTCAAFLKLLLESQYDIKTVVFSIDDFYLTKQERNQLAGDVHPLFATRGVPGTHDVDLLLNVLSSLPDGCETRVPQFDKAVDDRMDADAWLSVNGDVDMVILEGWCVGLGPQTSQDLETPVNTLERLEDADAIWRSYVNQQLEGPYRHVFDKIDLQIVLQAPSFDCVYEWRAKQEKKLITALKATGHSTSETLNAKQLERFISHYERLTRHALQHLPSSADCVLQLNEDHTFSTLTVSGDE